MPADASRSSAEVEEQGTAVDVVDPDRSHGPGDFRGLEKTIGINKPNLDQEHQTELAERRQTLIDEQHGYALTINNFMKVYQDFRLEQQPEVPAAALKKWTSEVIKMHHEDVKAAFSEDEKLGAPIDKPSFADQEPGQLDGKELTDELDQTKQASFYQRYGHHQLTEETEVLLGKLAVLESGRH